ncbi:MAG: hypothetical protein AAF493_16880, partial [Pseudomonadota bacterium]
DITDDQSHLAVIRDRRFKYVHFPTLPPVLFDLDDDPHETRNCAHERASIVAQYASKLLSHRMQFEARARTQFNQIYGEPMRHFPRNEVRHPDG